MPQPSGERGRWIERGPSGQAHALLGPLATPSSLDRIAEHLNIELGEVELETFANGETYCRYRESIRGADVFIVQSCHGRATNDHLMELADHDPGGEARLREPHHGRHALVPVLTPGQEVVAARADHREARRRHAPAAGVDRVLTMDLHAGQIQGFFTFRSTT